MLKITIFTIPILYNRAAKLQQAARRTKYFLTFFFIYRPTSSAMSPETRPERHKKRRGSSLELPFSFFM